MKTTERNATLAAIPGTLFFAETRGGKRAIRIDLLGTYAGVDQFNASTWSDDRQDGQFGSTREHTRQRCAQLIHDAKLCDGINYEIRHDEFGVGELLKAADPARWYPAALVNAAIDNTY